MSSTKLFGKKVGVFSVVVECTLKKVVDELIKSSDLPIIGIGASESCRGQIIVTEDILGMTELKTKFSKKCVGVLISTLRSFKDQMFAQPFLQKDSKACGLLQDFLNKRTTYVFLSQQSILL